MAFRRIGSPENDQVRAVADLPQRASDFAHALKRHPGRSVANAGRRVHVAADPIRNADGHALRFARRVAQAIDQRVLGLGQDLRGAFHPLLDRRRMAVDAAGRLILDVVVEKPGFAQHAGSFRFHDVRTVDLQFDVVANTPTKSAGGVGHDLELPVRCQVACHEFVSRSRWDWSRSTWFDRRPVGSLWTVAVLRAPVWTAQESHLLLSGRLRRAILLVTATHG